MKFCSQAAARRRTRGGTSGSNRGPAARTKGSTQAHAGARGAEPGVPTEAPHQGRRRGLPGLVNFFFAKASGTDEIALNLASPSPARARAGEGGLGSVRQVQFWHAEGAISSVFQNFKILRYVLVLHHNRPSVGRNINAGFFSILHENSDTLPHHDRSGGKIRTKTERLAFLQHARVRSQTADA